MDHPRDPVMNHLLAIRFWLVVWLPFSIFPYIGFLTIPIDFHIFQRGGPTTNQIFLVFSIYEPPIFNYSWSRLLVADCGVTEGQALLETCAGNRELWSYSAIYKRKPSPVGSPFLTFGGLMGTCKDFQCLGGLQKSSLNHSKKWGGARSTHETMATLPRRSLSFYRESVENSFKTQDGSKPTKLPGWWFGCHFLFSHILGF